MAEYIDKQIILDKCQRLIDVERKQGSDVMNYGRERVNQTEVIMEYIEYMTPTADVVERSEYEKILEENRKMKEVLSGHYEIKYNHLRSDIDKAIEEIDFLRQHRAKYITEDNKICIDSGEVIKILKNIGE